MKHKRTCESCGKEFKEMTDKQWKHVNYEHLTMHKKHANLTAAITK